MQAEEVAPMDEGVLRVGRGRHLERPGVGDVVDRLDVGVAVERVGHEVAALLGPVSRPAK